MDIFELPLEIIEKIFLNLDTQALATCALADPRFAETIYSSHFLDDYCRISFDCTLITAADVCNATVAMPFEFWYWVYTTMKLDQTDQGDIVFHSKYLTKIGTLKHMYIMWLVCGLRSSYMYSYALMYELYPLPFTVKDAFELTSHSGILVNDVLTKAFLALPSIMDLTCSNSLEYFSMQEGGNTSLPMDIVCNDGITPKLPIDFSPIFSVEIIASPVLGKSSAVLLLINQDRWVMWIGYLNISQDGLETTVGETCLSKYFNHSDKITDIRFHAQNAMQEVISLVYSLREGISSPIISYSSPDINDITISLAQQHHSGLYKKFESVLDEFSSKLASTITTKFCDGSSKCRERIINILDGKMSQNTQLNTYVANLLKVDSGMNHVKMLNMQQHLLSGIILKTILERIASLYRNEIHFFIENSFCHTFLCGCIGYACPVSTIADENVEDKIEKCMSDKMKDSMYNPNMWPSHILSAACCIVPSLIVILENDLHMVLSKGLKYVIPNHSQRKINEYLRNAGLVLTQRPPSKPRCPPLLNQVRLWSIESLA